LTFSVFQSRATRIAEIDIVREVASTQISRDEIHSPGRAGIVNVNVEDRKGSSLIPNAMAEHIAQGYRNIASDAARDNPEAYGPFLRMMADEHEQHRDRIRPK
jgi:hypothetical protein